VSTNGIYVNGEKCTPNVYHDLTRNCYVHLLKSKNEEVLPNFGFRVVMTTTIRPKFEDEYVLGTELGKYYPLSWTEN
jgi:hypothetical protein